MLCSKTLSCSHQGISDVKSHLSGKNHQQMASQMTNQAQLPFTSREDPLSEKVLQQITVKYLPIVMVNHTFRLQELNGKDHKLRG